MSVSFETVCVLIITSLNTKFMAGLDSLLAKSLGASIEDNLGGDTLHKIDNRLFEKYGVDLVLSGHNAIYGRSVPLINAQSSSPYATATTVESGGVVYVTTGGGGDVLDPPYTDSFHRSPGATFSSHHYTKVTVYDCVLSLTAVDKSGAPQDSFTIDRCP